MTEKKRSDEKKCEGERFKVERRIQGQRHRDKEGEAVYNII